MTICGPPSTAPSDLYELWTSNVSPSSIPSWRKPSTKLSNVNISSSKITSRHCEPRFLRRSNLLYYRDLPTSVEIASLGYRPARNDETFSYASRSLPKFFFQSAFCSTVFLPDSPIFLKDLRFFIAYKIFCARSSASPSRKSQPFSPSMIHSLLPGISETRQGKPHASASSNETDVPSTCDGEI